MANCARIMLHSSAYINMHTLREKALAGADFATAQFDSIWLSLLKIGAVVRVMEIKLHFTLPSSFPLKDVIIAMQHNVVSLS